MTATLETDRLLLQPLEVSDADQIQELFPHWELVRFLSAAVPWPYPPDGALTYCRDVAIPGAERGDEWHWTLRLKGESFRMIGSISLFKGDNQNRGFWMGLPWRRKGLMTEACDAATDYWFSVLKFPVLRTVKAVANTDSRGISVRQGMRVVRIVDHRFVSGILPAEIWELTADEWHEHLGSRRRLDNER